MSILKDQTFKRLTQIILVLGLVLALYLNKDATAISIASTIALMAGFFNIYFTTNRSKYFLIPDLIWIVASVYVLFASQNYTDILLYIFYIFVGFFQYYNWSKHETYEHKVEVDYGVKIALIFLGIGVIITLLDFLLLQGSSNALLGAIISGFGIGASVLLALRNYFAEVIYVVVNFLQLILYIIIGQGNLALIPLIFFIMSLIFVVQNRPRRIS